MHPIRNIKEKIGSCVEDIAVTAPQIVKDASIAVTDQVKNFNEKVLEPTEQQLADEHGYTHGGKREKIVKHLTGIGKYEAGAHFINKHVVNPMRRNHDKDNPPDSTAT
ncbi:unnamed protein product [Rotaria sordida]|uniref:Uncharacterized protein n=1 Tax=Rotaria sordida TaxID=392033 RepID=A0A814XF70_9BILA|nr:unnamed protein product [Rotaria sordida]CAF1162807.1 unnamed protein product [Rotaria sordida]CAF1214920.1 unnamed protein product [Rotaria sordida]CAF1460950.1 unnamed protein product [Rotaria sordida]CAF3794339.1 unnamed protein product [Rotaria sordida]